MCIDWVNSMVNLVHFFKIFHFSTWCPICGRSRLHSTGGLNMPCNSPTAMSRMSFCIIFLKGVLGLFFGCTLPQLWLYAVTFHWASLPSTLQVHIKSYADKLSFLIHRQQQVWLEGNLIYLEYSGMEGNYFTAIFANAFITDTQPLQN